MPDEIKSREGGYKKCMMDSEQSDIDVDPLSRRETIEFVRNDYNIPDLQARRDIHELNKTLARFPKHGCQRHRVSEQTSYQPLQRFQTFIPAAGWGCVPSITL